MTKETKQLARAERLLLELRDLFAAVEDQQVCSMKARDGVVPVSLYNFMGGLRHQVNSYFIDSKLGTQP